MDNYFQLNETSKRNGFLFLSSSHRIECQSEFYERHIEIRRKKNVFPSFLRHMSQRKHQNIFIIYIITMQWIAYYSE